MSTVLARHRSPPHRYPDYPCTMLRDEVMVPKKAREILGLQAGHKIQVIVYEDRIELIPVKPVRLARGFLNGIDTDVKREPDRL